MIDVRNTLRGGIVSEGELINSTYRYRISTSRMAAMIAFRDTLIAVVVTAWRKK